MNSMESSLPLPELLRPQTLDDVVGQDDTEPSVSNLKSQLTGEDILALWTLTKSLYPLRDARQMNQYLVRLCRATRPIDGEEKKVFSIYGLSSHDDGNRGEKIFFGDIVETGVSTRAQKFLARAARAYAFYKGAKFLTPQHVKAVAHRVLRHRIVLTHQAESIYKITTDNVIDYLLSNVSETDVR